jgi:ubiquinone/menaquinone biosynthesis C-methylase UbiE
MLFDYELGTTWPLIMSTFIMVLCIFYLWAIRMSYKRRHGLNLEGVEGFANPGSDGIDQRIDGNCYDEFYAKVYDSLVQPSARAGLEVQTPLEWIEKTGKPVSDIRVADIGCGTGIHAELFKQKGVHSVIGYDSSKDMIAEAKRRYPDSDFRVGDATVATMAAAEQFDLITMFYFTIYLIPDRMALLKNIYLWLSPGGIFVCHIVNKLKFDPILESASPFVGFSIQKYAEDRVTKSSVTFDEFEYTGDFQLHGSRGIYEEEFTFKNGKRRRHEQRVWMPDIELMVKEIASVGFKYQHHVDLTPIGYEYNYLFFFGR